uniref:Uncharacterized protein n=1 Tax=Arundo donax TaxID=35708 RepID=A0A0A9ADR0_ARUDO
MQLVSEKLGTRRLRSCNVACDFLVSLMIESLLGSNSEATMLQPLIIHHLTCYLRLFLQHQLKQADCKGSQSQNWRCKNDAQIPERKKMEE